MSNILKIVHVSDLHFAGTPGVLSVVDASLMQSLLIRARSTADWTADYLNGRHNPEIAEIAADFLLRNLHDHDCIVISGDLATRGTLGDLKAAAEFVLAPSSANNTSFTPDGKPTLNVGNKPIVILPGNHDRFKDAKCFPNATHFDDVFHSKWRNGPRSVMATKITNRYGSSINAIAADFCLETTLDADPIAFFPGQGRCTASTLTELARQTRASREKFPDRGIIWISHFLPSSSSRSVSRSHELVDGQALIDLAEECNVKYLICGHVHSHHRTQHKNLCLIVAGTLCILGSSSGNWIHSITFRNVGGEVELIDQENYRYEGVEKTYVPI